jgi:hypothetical protein
MGTSFSSIHVINTDISSVEIRLANCQHASNLSLSSHIQENLKSKNLDVDFNELFNFLTEFHSFKQPVISFYSRQIGKNVSVFSDFFTFENILEIAQEYFNDMPNIVIAISLLDSDILNVSFLKKGKLLTSLTKGAPLNIFNMTSHDLNTQILQKYFSIPKEQFDFLMQHSDLEEICNHLTNIFNLPMNIGINSIDKKDPHIHRCDFIV